MSALYHGVDIVEVARIRRAAERHGERFLRRVFTAGELADCGAGGGALRYSSLAARWAAKEAAAKALGIGLSGLGAAPADESGRPRPGLHDIEVAREPSGRPALRLYGPAAALAAELGLSTLSLSLSHTAEYAVASVVGLAPRVGQLSPEGAEG